MVADDGWFTEKAEEVGTAFSLRIREKLHEEETAFQRIAVYATETFGNLMVIDGYVMLSARDHFIYHEMMTHPALFAHSGVRDVAIIGGGDCGSLCEVLRHQGVCSATQVEIDERVTRVAERYFPELCVANNDPRARFEFVDGIAWMAERPPASLDLIVVDSTDPVGPAVGLFTQTFYQHCLCALRPGGVLVAQSESPFAHTQLVCAMAGAMRGAGFAHTHVLSFPQPVYPSGWWSATLACKGEQRLQLPAHLGDVVTRYYTPAVHQAAFAQPAFLAEALDQALPG